MERFDSILFFWGEKLDLPTSSTSTGAQSQRACATLTVAVWFAALLVFTAVSVGAQCQGRAPYTPGRGGAVIDKYGRHMTDLRIAITDRCSYRCVCCRTGNDGAQLCSNSRWTTTSASHRFFVSLGIEKIRLTVASPCCARVWSSLWRELRASGPLMVYSGSRFNRNGHLLEGMKRP